MISFIPSIASCMLIVISALMISNIVPTAQAELLLKKTLVNPVTPASFSDHLTGGVYSVVVTDTWGGLHDMIVSTVSLGTWFATTTMTCPGTPNEYPACGFNPGVLYNPAGVATTGSYCSTGVKVDPHAYTECYKIMSNYSITLGNGTPQNPDLQLVASVGLLTNMTWDGSHQSGMLGLAHPLDAQASGTGTSLLDDMATRYSQPKQFTLALSRDPNSGGYLTFGSALPPTARPLTDPGVFVTPMQDSVINGRVNNLYVVTAGITLASAPSTTAQYVIDSGDVFLRAPPDNAAAVNGAWTPAGVAVNDGSGRYSVQCTAQPPSIGLVVDGHPFTINGADLLWTEGGCYSNVIAAQNDLFVLGQPFLNNVMATFDLDNNQIYFQQGFDMAGAPLNTTSVSATSTVMTPAAGSPTPASGSTTTSVPPTASAATPTIAPSTPSTWYVQGPSQSVHGATLSTSLSITTTTLAATTTSFVTQVVTPSVA